MANSYMITNRSDPSAKHAKEIVPLRGSLESSLWWYMAPKPFDERAKDYEKQSSDPSVDAPSTFSSALIAELKAQPNPKLVVYIHGLGKLWAGAITETAELGKHLKDEAQFSGTVIGFSWPSYRLLTTGLYSSRYAFPPKKKRGTTRDNINGSRLSFGSLLDFLQGMRASVSDLSISVVCHSEGTYMMMLGTYEVSSEPINQVLLLAGDINNAALQIPSPPLTGQGQGIATNAIRVTTYYTADDDTLTGSETVYGKTQFHNPVYGGRLGQLGPSYNYGAQQPNTDGLDCSLVINYQNVRALQKAGVVPPHTTLHHSYRYIPQVLQDMAQVLDGASGPSIPHRSKTANTHSYLMDLVS